MQPLQLSVMLFTEDKPYLHEKGYRGFYPRTFKSIDDLRDKLTSIPYSSSLFTSMDEIKKLPDIVSAKDGKTRKATQRSTQNVEQLFPVLILDIDDGLSIDGACDILDKAGVGYLLLSSKSHQIEKHGLVADRFRILIPLESERHKEYNGVGFEVNGDKKIRKMRVEQYKMLIIELTRHLGLLDYTDPSALTDVARKYMPSPKDCVFINHLDRDALIIDRFVPIAVSAYRDMEAEKKRKAAERKLIAEKYQSTTLDEKMREASYWPQVIDAAKINALDLTPVLYYYESKKSETSVRTDGNYEYVRNEDKKYSIIFNEDEGHYVWHDFKSGQSGNIYTYFRDELGITGMKEIAEELNENFPEAELFVDNPYFYIKKLEQIICKPKSYGEKVLLSLGAKEISVPDSRDRIIILGQNENEIKEIMMTEKSKQLLLDVIGKKKIGIDSPQPENSENRAMPSTRKP